MNRFDTTGWGQLLEMQLHQPKLTTAIIMSKKQKTSSNLPLWARSLIAREASHVIINAQRGQVLCYAMPCGSSSPGGVPQAQWIPVEFSSAEAAADFVENASIPELSRQLGAVVEWRKELIGAMPAPPAPIAGAEVARVGALPTPPPPSSAAPDVQPGQPAGWPLPAGPTATY